MKLKTKIKIRKTHRYLGLFLGIQFLFWTISGLYFSWTDLDEIHGDHFKKIPEIKAFSNLISPSEIQIDIRQLNRYPSLSIDWIVHSCFLGFHVLLIILP